MLKSAITNRNMVEWVCIFCVWMHICIACACMSCACVCIVQLYVCVSMQFAAAFARVFKKGPFKEVAFNFMSSRQLGKDLWKSI